MVLTTDNVVDLSYDDDPDPTETYFPNQTLRWAIHCGSSGYIVEVDTTAAFNSPALIHKDVSWSKTDGKGTASTEVSNLYLGKMQYWRVKAYNGSDSTPWSEVRRFHTMSKAVGTFPKDMETAYTQQKFQWKYQRGLTNVIIEIDTTADFSSPAKRVETSSGSSQDYCYTQVNCLYFNKTHYWRVRSYHQRDTTEWSDVLSFHTYRRASLSSPADSTVNMLTAQKLYFNYHTGISKYQMQLDTVPTFDSPAFQNRIEGASSSEYAYGSYSNLLFGATYFWRVRDCHARDTSDWSETRRFTTYDWGGLSSPANESTDVSYSSVNLYFKYRSNISKYHIQLDTVPTFDSPLLNDAIEGASSSSYAYRNYKNLLQGTDYYWRVRDCQQNDTSGWSAVWRFTTRTTLPAPTLTAPANQTGSYSPSDATFTWSAVEGATSYILQVADNGQFSPSLIQLTTTSSTAMVDLPASSILYWRVQAIFPDGRSLWSSIWGINTGGFPTELDALSTTNVRKILRNGQILILRPEGTYDLTGRKQE